MRPVKMMNSIEYKRQVKNLPKLIVVTITIAPVSALSPHTANRLQIIIHHCIKIVQCAARTRNEVSSSDPIKSRKVYYIEISEK